MSGLRTDISSTNDMDGNDDIIRQVGVNKKQPRIMDLEVIFSSRLPRLRSFFNKTTFCVSILSQLVRASRLRVETTQQTIDGLENDDGNDAFYTKGGKYASDTAVGSRSKVSVVVSFG